MGKRSPRPKPDPFAPATEEDFFAASEPVLQSLGQLSFSPEDALLPIVLHRTTTFEPWSRLPYDIREKIWKLLLCPGPQLIELHVDIRTYPERWRRHEPHDLVWKHIAMAPSTRRLPSILHVCKESRELALRNGSMGMGNTQRLDFPSEHHDYPRSQKPCKLENQIDAQSRYTFWNPRYDAVLLKTVSDSEVCGSRSKCQRHSTFNQIQLDKRLRFLIFRDSSHRDSSHHTKIDFIIPALPKLEVVIVLSFVWNEFTAWRRWLSKKTLAKVRRRFREIEEFWLEQIQNIKQDSVKPSCKDIAVLVMTDEVEAMEEVQLGFPSLREEKAEYEFHWPEDAAWPRRRLCHPSLSKPRVPAWVDYTEVFDWPG